MELIINGHPYLKNCYEAQFLFQAFEIDTIDFTGFKENKEIGEIKVYLKVSLNEQLDTNLPKSKIQQELHKIYRNFYQEIKACEESSFYFLMNKKYYLEWFEEEAEIEDICKEITTDISDKFKHTKLTYLPNDLTTLIGTSINEQASFQALSELKMLQEKKSDYEFLEKAPMDIGLIIVVGATILGIQVFLWNRIGIALNTYYYAQQYSSFFWTFGITIIVFLLIILLLFIPLFFSLRSGLRDFVRWIKIIRSKK